MATGFDLKEWTTSIYKVHEAVRIAIVPPWQIEDVKGHPAVNLGSLAVATGLYLLLREFTPRGNLGLSESGVLIALVLIFLFAIGVVVNFLTPNGSAAKLSNRWSTFTIVMFFYSSGALFLASFLVPIATGRNLYEPLAIALGSDVRAWLAATLVATVVAAALLYARTYWWFRRLQSQSPAFLFAALIVCTLVNWAILFVLLFVV